MHTTSLIRRHISLVPPGQLFTTRGMLTYGTRSAVDSALSRFVKSGWIRRVARAVFVRDNRMERREHSVDEIARIKAESFGRHIACHGRLAAIGLGLIEPSQREEPIYAINGSSSSFFTIHGVIRFKGICPRFLQAGDSKPGLAIRALRYLGPGRSNPSVAAKATRSFNRVERDELHLNAGFMTSWMVACFNWPVRSTYDLMKGKLPPIP